MSKHTPGPWAVKIEAYPMADSGDYDSCFAVYSSSPKHPIVQIWEEGEEAEANARLIAAAPDLLEALKSCAAVCAGEEMSKSGLIRALEQARAAIAKATGKTA